MSVVAINFLSWHFKLVNGGMTGYALFFSYLFEFNTALILFILNSINIAISFTFGDQKIGFKAIYGFIYTSIMLEVTREVFNLAQIEVSYLQSIIVTVLNALIASIGVYLCIRNGYSTGSFSTLYLVIKKYLSYISAPVFFLLLDTILALLILFTFGFWQFIILILNSFVFFYTMRYCEYIKLVEYLKLR